MKTVTNYKLRENNNVIARNVMTKQSINRNSGLVAFGEPFGFHCFAVRNDDKQIIIK